MERVNCTACGQQVNHFQRDSVYRHPMLKVLICKVCICESLRLMCVCVCRCKVYVTKQESLKIDTTFSYLHNFLQ